MPAERVAGTAVDGVNDVELACDAAGRSCVMGQVQSILFGPFEREFDTDPLLRDRLGRHDVSGQHPVIRWVGAEPLLDDSHDELAAYGRRADWFFCPEDFHVHGVSQARQRPT